MPPRPGVGVSAASASRPAFFALALFALVGAIFAAVSTFDFIAHLDRQMHAIVCSILPGIGAADASGSSGCHAVLMSPYSSVFRTMTWGGIPIALPALGVFGFLLFRGLELALRRTADRRDTGFLVLATALPVVTSVVYLIISVVKVGAVCKVCSGIYVASLGVLVSALWAHVKAPAAARARGQFANWTLHFLEGCALVLVPIMLYMVLKPAYPEALAKRSELRHPEDKFGVMVDLNGAGKIPVIEVLDPLCPGCKGLSQRLAASPQEESLRLSVVLFPLDHECNWMVSESPHPGACAVSEAVLCAGPRAPAVLDWAFAHQTELREEGRRGPGALYPRLRQQFPELASCLGQPAVRTRLNRSMRWMVANSLPVLTPQLFVRNQKIPDEDTDLGLEYVLARTLEVQP